MIKYRITERSDGLFCLERKMWKLWWGEVYRYLTLDEAKDAYQRIKNYYANHSYKVVWTSD